MFIYRVWEWVMVIFRWLFLFSSVAATIIDEQQYFPDRTIWSWLFNRGVYTPEGLSARLYVHHVTFHGFRKIIFSFFFCEQYKTSSRSSWKATYHPSRKLSKLDEADMQDTAGEAGTSS